MPAPELLFGHASPLSVGGRSLFDQGATVRPFNVLSFSSAPTVVQAAANRLKEASFEILQITPLTINFAAPMEAIEEAAGTKIVSREFKRPNGGSATFFDSPDTTMLGLVTPKRTHLADVIEGIALESPRDLMSASPAAPFADYWHLDVPGDVANGCNATQLHRFGITGRGVRVAMVDSGWFRHPYFTAQGYNVLPVTLAPGASDPDADESGHGTGESANILAIAPDCELLPVKANFANTIAAFNAAVDLQPDIITCSWGSHSPFALSASDVVLGASVSAAVAQGITVIFSAGNGHAGFPGQHPDVICAGGVFLGPDGSMEASNYSSGFRSLIYPGRKVPDVCGLVGLRPKAIYIMLPVQPGDSIDNENAGGIFPDGDQTDPDDGWAAFSGTSAAAPQLAGVAALIKQIVPHASGSAVKSAIANNARDVVIGSCSPVPDLHSGLPAAVGDDDATGPGLVDAYMAVVGAYTDFVSGFSEQTGANGTMAAYQQGVADATAFAAAMSSDVPGLTSYLQSLSAQSAALAQLYWSAAL